MQTRIFTPLSVLFFCLLPRVSATPYYAQIEQGSASEPSPSDIKTQCKAKPASAISCTGRLNSIPTAKQCNAESKLKHSRTLEPRRDSRYRCSQGSASNRVVWSLSRPHCTLGRPRQKVLIIAVRSVAPTAALLHWLYEASDTDVALTHATCGQAPCTERACLELTASSSRLMHVGFCSGNSKHSTACT